MQKAGNKCGMIYLKLDLESFIDCFIYCCSELSNKNVKTIIKRGDSIEISRYFKDCISFL